MKNVIPFFSYSGKDTASNFNTCTSQIISKINDFVATQPFISIDVSEENMKIKPDEGVSMKKFGMSDSELGSTSQTDKRQIFAKNIEKV